MTVYIVLETRREKTIVDSIWTKLEYARAQVDMILRTKTRPELWGAFSLDLIWTDGNGIIEIVKREMNEPGILHGVEVKDEGPGKERNNR